MLEPTPAVVVTVKQTNGSLVRGADVLLILADGRRISATTGNDGTAQLENVPDGQQTVYAWANNLRPNTATATVANHAGSATITLTPGEVASAGLTSHRMTQRRDRRRGHQPVTIPRNSQVYTFEAHIAVGPTNYTASGSCPRPASTAAAARRAGAAARSAAACT